MNNWFTMQQSSRPLVATAVHAGHALRPAVTSCIAIDEPTRLREEDPFTDRLIDIDGIQLTVDQSRFELDLNRPREQAVYLEPEDAWGLTVWREPLPESELEISLAMYDDFYRALQDELDALAQRGPFLVFDVHSYNHRRAGPNAPAEPPLENPEVNVGTGSLDRARWGWLVDRFVENLRGRDVKGHPLDVHENIRFRGGHLSEWVNERYNGTGFALALEFKKTFMNEWSGVPDLDHLNQLRGALGRTAGAVIDELAADSK